MGNLIVLFFKEILKSFYKVYDRIFIYIKYYGKLKFGFSSYISRNSIFEGANRIYPKTFFSGSLGYGSYIGNNCEISAHIGRFTSIAPHVRSNHGIHPFTYPFASCSPMFYSLKKQSGKTFACRMVFDEYKDMPQIGNDCWIGENVFLCGGIKVGDGAIIHAGSVVTKDVPPYSIVGGVPAKVINYRYNESDIQFLLGIKWWNKDYNWFTENWELLCDIRKLKEYFKDDEN